MTQNWIHLISTNLKYKRQIQQKQKGKKEKKKLLFPILTSLETPQIRRPTSCVGISHGRRKKKKKAPLFPSPADAPRRRRSLAARGQSKQARRRPSMAAVEGGIGEVQVSVNLLASCFSFLFLLWVWFLLQNERELSKDSISLPSSRPD